ncbi:MAG TPA: GNAT family N-acetyltransferase [Labilithrix sp.]|nr:GNAT family N-acetyltransferase [Labilithrix sp.]
MPSEVRVRSAVRADHPSFARLFPELAVDDPVLDEEQFALTLVPTTILAVSPEDGSVLGYAYYQLMKDVAYVRHVVTSPEARRRGVARRLLAEVVARARAAQCTSWCLNVKPTNLPAIALYESLGMQRAHASRALEIAWAIVDAAAPTEDRVTSRDVAPEDDARVEAAMDLLAGQLAGGRALSGRVVKMLDEDGAVAGAAIFHPDFPGAYPFRVARPELALVLLRALRPHARPDHATLNVVSEGQPEVADALEAAGARRKLDILHLKGPLPQA